MKDSRLSEKKEQDMAKSCLQEGAVCLNCGEGRLVYDGLLNLHCPTCGLVIGGSFT